MIRERLRTPKFLAEAAEKADETAEWIDLPFRVFFRAICVIRERLRLPKILAEAAENADEAAEWIGLPFSVFFCAICAICERERKLINSRKPRKTQTKPQEGINSQRHEWIPGYRWDRGAHILF